MSLQKCNKKPMLLGALHSEIMSAARILESVCENERQKCFAPINVGGSGGIGTETE